MNFFWDFFFFVECVGDYMNVQPLQKEFTIFHSPSPLPSSLDSFPSL